MSTKTKVKIAILISLSFGIVWLFVSGYNAIVRAPKASALSYDYSCPDGTYPIGDGICKNEPTGCPYGESIPVDSPKCVPPAIEQAPIITSPQDKNNNAAPAEAAPVLIDFGGK